MKINLNSTTESLEIELQQAQTIHYITEYVDITTSGTSNVVSTNGAPNTVATHTIVSAPSADTTRQVSEVRLYNAGTATCTILLKRDFNGTDRTIQKITLQVGESYVMSEARIYDASGREKSQAGDIEITGDNRAIYKVGTAPEAAGVMYSFAKDSGFPGAWAPGTPGVNGRNTDGTQAADAGCINMGNPASGNWYLRALDIIATQLGQVVFFDVLWVNSGLVVTTVTAQAITQPTLPARDNNGGTNGAGVQVGILVTGATTNAGAITNMTLSYTNQDGVGPRTATIASFPATAVIGTFVQFQLQAGDTGVRNIISVTFGTSLGGGSVSLVCFNPIAYEPINVVNTGAFTAVKRDTKMFNGHCLLPFWWASGTGAVTINGGITFVNK